MGCEQPTDEEVREDLIRDLVVKQIDNCFDSVVSMFELKSGDIEPLHHLRVEQLKDELYIILLSFVTNNIK